MTMTVVVDFTVTAQSLLHRTPLGYRLYFCKDRVDEDGERKTVKKLSEERKNST